MTTIAAGTVATSVIDAITATHNTSTAATSTLQGLVSNLTNASSATGQEAIANQIMMTPNAGVAGQIAEKLVNDLHIPDATQRSLAVMQDIMYIQAAVNAMAHQTGVISSFLASLGL
ncbi:MAG: hypothetical protein WBX25_24090 [Rhodomicrobium sp.]